MKTVLILIGPKGSGKSYIGRLIENDLGIKFLSIEPIFHKILGNSNKLDKKVEKEGYDKVEKEIDSIFSNDDTVTIESTGSFEYFFKLLKNLKSKYSVKFIQIYTSLELCAERLRHKDPSIHVPFSARQIKEINEKSSNLKLEYDLIIDNSKLSDTEIVSLIKIII